jgi:hypothetical protein
MCSSEIFCVGTHPEMSQSHIQSLVECPIDYIKYKFLTKHGREGLTKEPRTHYYTGSTVTVRFVYFSKKEITAPLVFLCRPMTQHFTSVTLNMHWQVLSITSPYGRHGILAWTILH